MAEALVKKKFHFGWIIFIAMCLNCFTIYNVSWNSLFVLPLASALGVTRGAILVFATCYSFSGIISSMLYGALLANKKVPLWILMGGGMIVQLFMYALFAFGNQLWMIYVAGILMGIPVQGCLIISTTVYASNWYDARVRGKLLSIQNSCQGLGTMIWPIVVQLIINASGYQMAYAFLAVISIPSLILGFVIKRTPDEVGLKQLGYREGNTGTVDKPKEDASYGWNLRHAIRTAGFWFMIMAVISLGMENGFTSNFSGIAQEFLGSDVDFAMIAALMLSIQSTCNMIGNLVVGFVVDIIGAKKTTVIWLTIFTMFFIIVMLFGHNEIALYVAAGCFGLNSGILRNPFPMTVRELFGPRYFSSIWGVTNAVKPMVSGLAATCIAFSYDFTGSYYGALVYGLVMALLTFVFFFSGARFLGKYDYKNTPDLDSGKKDRAAA